MVIVLMVSNVSNPSVFLDGIVLTGQDGGYCDKMLRLGQTGTASPGHLQFLSENCVITIFVRPLAVTFRLSSAFNSIILTEFNNF